MDSAPPNWIEVPSKMKNPPIFPLSWTPNTTAQMPRTDFEQDRDQQGKIA
jgi:hypothetical protein